MKKIIAMLLAIVMVCALSVSVFALDATTGDATQDVTGSYVQATPENAVYNITISWTTATFNYVVADKVWNAENHVWEDPENLNGAFQAAAYSVTITNDSSAKITALAAFDAVEGLDVDGTFNDGENDVTEAVTLEAPIESSEGRSVTLTLSLSGTVAPEEWPEDNKIGTVTITLGEVA